MSRRSLVLVLAACAVPATAQTFDFTAQRAAACITISNAQYRLAAPGERADYTLRLDPAATVPDVRLQLTASIDEADFVLIGDADGAPRCAGFAAARTIAIDPNAAAPDLTIAFARPDMPADYRIYVQGSAIAPDTAAALYAAAQIPARRLALRFRSSPQIAAGSARTSETKEH